MTQANIDVTSINHKPSTNAPQGFFTRLPKQLTSSIDLFPAGFLTLTLCQAVGQICFSHRADDDDGTVTNFLSGS
jgi:hypothetical protein